MKNFTVIFTLIVSAIVTQSVFATARCIDKQQIKSINIGEVNNRQMGHDKGRAIFVVFSGGKELPVNNTMNLGDPQGASILATLNTAMAMGFKVSVFDHNGDICNDFDEILIERN